MHAEALEFVARTASTYYFELVIEFGSRNINGSVRSVIFCNRFWGIDLCPGPDVDEVADCAMWRNSEDPADLVVCCEVLEHSPNVEGIVLSAYENLKPGGMFLMTCATYPRKPHSAADGGPLQPGEHYENVDPDIFRATAQSVGFKVAEMDCHLTRGDLYAVAHR